MFKLIGKLIKFVIILSVILGLLVGALYLGSEVLDLEFCDDIVDGLEDLFDEIFDGSSSSARKDAILPGAGELKHIEGDFNSQIDLPAEILNVEADSNDVGYVVHVDCHWSEYREESDEWYGKGVVVAVGVDHEGIVRGAQVVEYWDIEDKKDISDIPESFIGRSFDSIASETSDILNGEIDNPYKAVCVGVTKAVACAAVLDGRYTPEEPEITE